IPPSDRQGDTLSGAVQRQKADEQRLLGGPRSSGNPYSATPYSSDGASPDDARDALTNEKHMHVVTPSDYYAASGARASGGGADSGSGWGSGGKASGSRRRFGATGTSRGGSGSAKNAGPGGRAQAAAYDYGASQTSPTRQRVYSSPYDNPYGPPGKSAAEL